VTESSAPSGSGSRPMREAEKPTNEATPGRSVGQDVSVDSPERADRPPTDDEVAARLTGLAQAVTDELGEAVVIEKESIPNASIEVTRLVPHKNGVCHVYWVEESSYGLILGVGKGGRWELSRDLKAVELIERIVRSVIDGRVTEVFAPNRSQVTVILDDGTPKISTEYRGLFALFPIPFWKHRGRTVTYERYRSGPS
jgi:hypothetical protein